MSPLLSGSQERQDKLREMGFVDILHKLSQASDTNLSDRWATAAHNKARSLVKQDTLRVHVCMCLAGRAKTAMQQYLAWPWWRRKVIRKTWLVLPLSSLVLFVDLWWVALHLPHFQLRQASVAWLFLLDAIVWVMLFSSFFPFFLPPSEQLGLVCALGPDSKLWTKTRT